MNQSNSEGHYVVLNEDRSGANIVGWGSLAANLGYSSMATSGGPRSIAITTGDKGNAWAKDGIAACTGDDSVATNSGSCGVAACTGANAKVQNEGDRGVAVTTGYYAKAVNLGKYGVALGAGHSPSAEACGGGGAAIAFGSGGRVKGEEGDVLVICNPSGAGGGKVGSAVVGLNGIEPGRWYFLNESGELEEWKHI